MKKILCLILLLGLFSAAALSRADELRVDFYDMGKADAMLITTPEGKRILIDTGTNKGGKKLVSRFQEEGIDRIDLLLITHYDKDHVGGADKILENVQVDTVVMPVYDKESKQHTQFEEALSGLANIDVYRVGRNKETAFESGDGLTMHVTAAHEKSYGKDEENDFSLAVRMTFGDVKLFFAGDAEAPRQRELLEEGNVACDVLKVPYHGKLTSMSEKFLSACAPKIAYITDDEEEPASEDVIAILEKLGTKVYTSRKDGGVTVVTDGKTVQVK